MDTTDRGLVFPEGGDPVEPLEDNFQALAESYGGPFQMAAGYEVLSVSSGTTANEDVTFPVGRFTSTPLVFLSSVGGTPNPWKLTPRAASPTASGFTLVVDSNTGSAVTAGITVAWVAIQMLTTGASG